MKKGVSILADLVLLVMVVVPQAVPAEDAITLLGATKLPEEHVYTKACEHFAEKVKEYYDGPLEVEVHHSGDLGNEKDFLNS